MRHSRNETALVQECEPPSIDRELRDFVRVNVRRCVQSRWPRMEEFQFPITRRFSMDLNHNAVLDTTITTQAIIVRNKVVAIIKSVEIHADADMPAEREASDVPTEAIEHVKLATLAGC